MNLLELANVFLEAATHDAIALHKGLEECAQLIEDDAKKQFGHYQPEVGPFPEWAELAEETKEAKERLGFVYNSEYNPLVQTGTMRDSIKHEVSGLEAVVGATDEKMLYHEFGTVTVPPRPVIGPAAFKNKEKIKDIIGHAMITGMFRLNGKMSPIHSALGYNMEIK